MDTIASISDSQATILPWQSTGEMPYGREIILNR